MQPVLRKRGSMKDEVQYVPSSSVVGLIFRKVNEKEIDIAQEENEYSSIENGALQADEAYSIGNSKTRNAKRIQESWAKHLQDFKEKFAEFKGKCSLMDCSVRYNELVRKYIKIFLQDAENLYIDTKSARDMDEDEDDSEYLRSKARKQLASIIYNVTYNVSALRNFGGLSFCWKVCGKDLHGIRLNKSKKMENQCSDDPCLQRELACLLTSLNRSSKRR